MWHVIDHSIVFSSFLCLIYGQSQANGYSNSTKDFETTFSFSNWVYFLRLSR